MIEDVKHGQHVMIIGRVTRLSPRDENDLQAISKRGGRVLSGPTDIVNLRPTTQGRYIARSTASYGRLGPPFIETWPGRHLCVKGTVPPDFRMVKIQAVRCLWKKGGQLNG